MISCAEENEVLGVHDDCSWCCYFCFDGGAGAGLAEREQKWYLYFFYLGGALVVNSICQSSSFKIDSTETLLFLYVEAYRGGNLEKC